MKLDILSIEKPINERNPNPTYTAKEVLEEKVTELMSRMWDAKAFIKEENEAFSVVIEGWRTELVFIRNAVRELKTNE